jgi:arylsulfatase A-like enzyme
VRNVFLVIVDCLRADFAHSHYLPFYRGSLVFRNCWATAGATVPGVHSILTGLLPSEHGGIYEDVRPTTPTVLDMFRERGYNVLAVTENPLTRWLGQYYPVYKSLGDGKYVTPGVGFDYIHEHLPDPPYFVLYHYMRAHHPYIAHPSHEDGSAVDPLDLNRGEPPRTWKIIQQLREAYERGVVESFWRLWELYRRYDDATFVITADHGEAFWEHGFVTHISDRMFPELLHVPLIVADRREGAPSQVWSPASNVDVPKIALRAGEGKRFVQRRTYTRAEDYQHWHPTTATRWGGWVGVSNAGNCWYYNLDDDPGMHHRLEEPPEEVVHRLARHMEIRKVTGQSAPLGDDPEVVERLRDLGYLS